MTILNRLTVELTTTEQHDGRRWHLRSCVLGASDVIIIKRKLKAQINRKTSQMSRDGAATENYS